VVQVEIINIHRDTIERMNGTANGCQIKHEMIKAEVSYSKKRTENKKS